MSEPKTARGPLVLCMTPLHIYIETVVCSTALIFIP